MFFKYLNLVDIFVIGGLCIWLKLTLPGHASANSTFKTRTRPQLMQ